MNALRKIRGAGDLDSDSVMLSVQPPSVKSKIRRASVRQLTGPGSAQRHSCKATCEAVQARTVVRLGFMVSVVPCSFLSSSSCQDSSIYTDFAPLRCGRERWESTQVPLIVLTYWLCLTSCPGHAVTSLVHTDVSTADKPIVVLIVLSTG